MSTSVKRNIAHLASNSSTPSGSLSAIPNNTHEVAIVSSPTSTTHSGSLKAIPTFPPASSLQQPVTVTATQGVDEKNSQNNNTNAEPGQQKNELIPRHANVVPANSNDDNENNNRTAQHKQSLPPQPVIELPLRNNEPMAAPSSSNNHQWSETPHYDSNTNANGSPRLSFPYSPLPFNPHNKNVIAVRPLHKVPVLLQNERPNITKIPSPKCENIIFQAALQQLHGQEHFAAFVATSASFRNSSFGPDFLMNLPVNRETIPLFDKIITPQECQPLQFTHSLKINADGCDEARINTFASEMVNSKYLPRQLKTLSIERASKSLISCFFGASSPPWTALKTLTIIDSRLSDAHLEVIATAASLVSLDISGSVTVTDEALRHLAKTNLKSLELRGCVNVTDAGLELLSGGQLGDSLATLQLAECENITDRGLEHVAAKFTQLETLSVAGCSDITDDGVKRIAENLASLRYLSLSLCHAVTDASLQHISTGLTGLVFLNLMYCNAITDAGVRHLTTGLPALSLLNLRWCSNVTVSAKSAFKAAHPNCRLL